MLLITGITGWSPCETQNITLRLVFNFCSSKKCQFFIVHCSVSPVQWLVLQRLALHTQLQGIAAWQARICVCVCVCVYICVRVCFLRFGMIYTTPHSINSSMTAQTCLCVHMLVWGIRLTEAHRQNSVDLLIDGGLSPFFFIFNTHTHANTHTHTSHSCLCFLLVPFI